MDLNVYLILQKWGKIVASQSLVWGMSALNINETGRV